MEKKKSNGDKRTQLQMYSGICGEKEMKATPKLLKKWELCLYNWDKKQDQDTTDVIYSLAFFIILMIISIFIWGIYFIF